MMKTVVTRASDYTYRDIVDFETLDELIAFMKDQRAALILSSNNPDYTHSLEADIQITIYDDYIE